MSQKTQYIISPSLPHQLPHGRDSHDFDDDQTMTDSLHSTGLSRTNTNTNQPLASQSQEYTHIPHLSSQNDSFMQPHFEIYLSQQEQLDQELLLYRHDTLIALDDANKIITEMNKQLLPQFSKQLNRVTKTTPQITRIQSKMMTIFTSLRKMRAQLIKAGVIIEGELDQVAEIDRKDKEELEARRQESIRKRQEMKQKLEQEQEDKTEVPQGTEQDHNNTDNDNDNKQEKTPSSSD